MLPCAMACAWAPHLLSPACSHTIACTPLNMSDPSLYWWPFRVPLFSHGTHTTVQMLHAADVKTAVANGLFATFAMA